MPCRDYDSDSWGQSTQIAQEWKERADMLARIACKAMNELEANKIETALLLRDDEVAQWWTQHKEADAKAERARLRAEEKERKRRAALAKLTAEEKKLLGL